MNEDDVFFFFFSMLGNMAFFFFSTVWTLCLQMFIEVDKGEVSTVKRCYTWASPAMEAVTPGAGGAYWKVWPWWGAAAQPLEAGEGWMDVVFFCRRGEGVGGKIRWQMLRMPSFFLLKWKKVELSDGVFFLVGLMIKVFCWGPGVDKSWETKQLFWKPPETPLLSG